jgi:NAD(P)-dependent dehydrogenase (short-subunit alcohol dehydrogenase family)
VFEDIHFERRPYDPWLAYGQSKTANVLFAVEGNARWASDGITVNALHPGAILQTNLSRYMSAAELENAKGRYTFKTPGQGAATSLLLDGVGGRYFEDCNEAEPNQPGTRRGIASYALDPEAAARLWQVSIDTLVSS